MLDFEKRDIQTNHEKQFRNHYHSQCDAGNSVTFGISLPKSDDRRNFGMAQSDQSVKTLDQMVVDGKRRR